MRQKPFTQELEEASTEKEVLILYKEVGILLKRLFNTDKRTLKRESDKIIFNSRLQLYSSLYRQTYKKAKIILQDNGRGTESLIPFDELYDLHRYNNSIELREGDINSKETEKDKQLKSKSKYTTLRNLENEYNTELKLLYKQKIEEAMAELQIFEKDNPDVIRTAITNSLVTFLERYKHQMGKETLTKVYHQIRKKACGSDNDIFTVTRERLSELTGGGAMTSSSPVGVNEFELPELDEVPDMPVDLGSKKRFSDLSKEERREVIKSVMEEIGWDVKSKAVKTKLIDRGYESLLYDDIYYALQYVLRNKK